MAGRRLLDAAKLYSAGRAIAKQHIALRESQIDVYTKTSTLAKAAKSQTDRVTLTAQAAIALAKRFNEPAPPNTYKSPTEQWRDGDDTIPRPETVGPGDSGDNHDKVPEGLRQDHHYRSDVKNAASKLVPDHELDIKQEEAAKEPYPDGTIPPSKQDLKAAPSPQETLGSTERSDSAHELSPDEARRLQRQAEDQIPRIFTADEAGNETIENKDLNPETFDDRVEDETTAYSSLPRQKIPKNTEDTQGGDSHVDSGHINQDVYYTSKGKQERQRIPSEEAIPKQDEIPDGVNTDVFHSPRISSMLSGKDKSNYGLDLRAASRAPNIGKGRKDDKSFTHASEQTPAEPRTTGAAETSQTSEESEKEMRDLGEALAKDAESTSLPPEQQVRFHAIDIMRLC